MIELMPHQVRVLEDTIDKNKVAYYLDMGLGKTFVGSEKAISFGKTILLICQKSKINDWVEHFMKHYTSDTGYKWLPYVLTNEKNLDEFIGDCNYTNCVGIINYELAWRRPELSKLNNFTLMLDESSLIQNETAKRSKFIINKLHPTNVVLLSGTPCNGKYESLWSQCHLLGWEISKKLFYNQYVIYDFDSEGYPVIVGYKNVERLKRKLRDYGAVFMKTDEVIDLPKQTFISVKIKESKEYNYFRKNRIVEVEDTQLVGDTTLTSMLYSRILCSLYHKEKLEAFKDLLESTNDRLIVFYNFTKEYLKLSAIANDLKRPISVVNGSVRSLENYEECNDSITFIQYQAGSYGLNLQKANRIIYFSPPLSTEQFEQSKKRIHRIGQEKPCYYYLMKTGIEHRIYETLEMRKDYTDDLFKEDFKKK